MVDSGIGGGQVPWWGWRRRPEDPVVVLRQGGLWLAMPFRTVSLLHTFSAGPLVDSLLLMHPICV